VSPEEKARIDIDRLLTAAGWTVADVSTANIHASRGVAIREFPLNAGFGFADYLLYVDGKAAGGIEAKKQGATLTGVEIQSGRYAQGLPAALPARCRLCTSPPASRRTSQACSTRNRAPATCSPSTGRRPSPTEPPRDSCRPYLAQEIVENLGAAMEQFRLIAADLGSNSADGLIRRDTGIADK